MDVALDFRLVFVKDLHIYIYNFVCIPLRLNYYGNDSLTVILCLSLELGILLLWMFSHPWLLVEAHSNKPIKSAI